MKLYCGVAMIGLVFLLSACGGGGDGSQVGTKAGETLESTAGSEAAGGSQAPRKTTAGWVALDGWETAETLGIVLADQRGYFTKAHLVVTTLAPISPVLSIPDVLNGSDLVGVAHGPQAVVSKAKGAPIVILGSLVPHANAALIWPKNSGIGGIADLKGKTIAIPGLTFQESFLESILARAGLKLSDVKIKKVGNELVPALVDGNADAIFGGSGNLEGADLKGLGVEPVITSVRDLGIPDYDELVLVARSDQTEKEPDVMRDFVAATVKGSALATEQPKSALQALENAGERNPAISPKARKAEVSQTIPLLSTDGQVSPERMQGLIDWMYEEGMIKSKIPVSELLADLG